MKLLIAGKNSYIGKNIGEFVRNQEPDSEICAISVRDDGWKQMDLFRFDAVVFAAAIVHRKDITDAELYHQVNACLPYEFAMQAKAQGVKRFLFLSTAAVYGVGKGLPEGNIISSETPLEPEGPYGQSKLEGERLLSQLADDSFLVSVVRPMNVYGKDCPGNYIPMFKKITRLLPLLPKAFLNARQGMIHVEHLSRLCYLALKADKGGVYHAQDDNPVSSYEIMCSLARGMGKKKASLPCHTAAKLFAWLGLVVKLFGGVAYTQELADCPLGQYVTEDTRKLLEEV